MQCSEQGSNLLGQIGLTLYRMLTDRLHRGSSNHSNESNNVEYVRSRAPRPDRKRSVYQVLLRITKRQRSDYGPDLIAELRQLRPEWFTPRIKTPKPKATKLDLFEQLRREHEFGVGTVAGVAAKFGVHRRMVRQVLAGALASRHNYPLRTKPKLSAVTAFLCLREVDAVMIVA
jgi:hypothetical protein